MPQAPATRQSIVELPFSLFISQCLCPPRTRRLVRAKRLPGNVGADPGPARQADWRNPGPTCMKEGFAQSRAEVKELRAEFKADNRALNQQKLDRLIEALLTTKQP